MPLFNRAPEEPEKPSPEQVAAPPRKSSLFSRHRSVSPSTVNTDNTDNTSTPAHKSSLFSRRRSASPDTVNTNTNTDNDNDNTSTSPKRHSILHRHDEDPSIARARERVVNAEAAESEADKALVVAKKAVKEARENIKILGQEAEREAKLAKIKQKEAAGLMKRGHGLGRFDQYI